jgi:xanthine dehydrogenase small subunit
MVSFILNNQFIETTLPNGSTVLDFVRYHKNLKGTKIGCREGDCGACTILVGDFEEEKIVYRSMTSCLMPLGNAQGKHILTVEGINLPFNKQNLPELSPVQRAMVETNGTQCGFCTIGFIMSFTGFTLHHQTKNYEEAIAAIDGNICRCTGYKSIERAAKLILEKLKDKPAKNTTVWLIERGFLPSYFINIEQRLKELKQAKTTKAFENGNPQKMLLGGGTDLIVQRPLTVKKSAAEFVFDDPLLKEITVKDGIIYLGGSVTVTAFAESEIIQKTFPNLKQYIKLVSSTPIRNMATIAGNLVNASPIGDMTIFLLALDAFIVLNKNGVKRIIKLKDFYKGYKTLDKYSDEIVEAIFFNAPLKRSHFNFEKVSKRTHLDIASVNSASLITITNDVIEDIDLSAGGVAPFPKYLANTASYLKGKRIDEIILNEAIGIMNAEVAPISDARGTAEYKRLLLRQLFLAHILKVIGPKTVQKILVQ